MLELAPIILEAELALAKNARETLSAWEKYLKSAKAIENVAQKYLEAQRMNEAGFLPTKIHRLEVEIRVIGLRNEVASKKK